MRISTGATVAPAPFFGDAFAFPRGVFGDFPRCDDPADPCEGDFDLLVPEPDRDLDLAASYFFFHLSKRACSSGLIFRWAYWQLSAVFLHSPIKCFMQTWSFFSVGDARAGEMERPRLGVSDLGVEAPSFFFPEPEAPEGPA